MDQESMRVYAAVINEFSTIMPESQQAILQEVNKFFDAVKSDSNVSYERNKHADLLDAIERCSNRTRGYRLLLSAGSFYLDGEREWTAPELNRQLLSIGKSVKSPSARVLELKAKGLINSRGRNDRKQNIWYLTDAGVSEVKRWFKK